MRCKVDGCPGDALASRGRYAGLCQTHKDDAVQRQKNEKESPRPVEAPPDSNPVPVHTHEETGLQEPGVCAACDAMRKLMGIGRPEIPDEAADEIVTEVTPNGGGTLVADMVRETRVLPSQELKSGDAVVARHGIEFTIETNAPVILRGRVTAPRESDTDGEILARLHMQVVATSSE